MNTLDVSSLPVDVSYICQDRSIVDPNKVLEAHRPAIDALASAGLIKQHDSFGFALAKPYPYNETGRHNYDWNNPHEFLWFVGGWGPDRDRYIANAVRKLRPLLRAEKELSTLELRLHNPEHFEDVVESIDSTGYFPWGDFPWGGGVTVDVGAGLGLAGAVSCLSEIEDDIVARLIVGSIAKLITLGDELLP